MTLDILEITQSLLLSFKQGNLDCIFKDHPHDRKRDVGAKPVLNLMGTNGMFSGETCIFRTLHFELIYPVSVPVLEDFLDFSERVDDLLNEFLQENDHLSLKYTPRFNVDTHKCLYLSVFTLDFTPQGSLYAQESTQESQELSHVA